MIERRHRPPRPALRRLAAAFVLALGLLIAHDFSVETGRGFAARAAIGAIESYRARVSPRLSGVVTCRFTPTCSAYGRAAFAKYGFAKGTAKTAVRIARCGPWTSQGTVDLP